MKITPPLGNSEDRGMKLAQEPVSSQRSSIGSSEKDTRQRWLGVPAGLCAGLLLAVHPIHAAVPIVTSFDESSGRLGTLLIVQGNDLDSVESVTVNGVPAEFSSNHSRTLRVNLPHGTDDGEVLLCSSEGCVSLGEFDFNEPPVLTEMSPTTAVAGDTITLTGQHLLETTSVEVLGGPELAFTVVSETTVTVEAPMLDPTYTFIALQTPYGNAPAGVLKIEEEGSPEPPEPTADEDDPAPPSPPGDVYTDIPEGWSSIVPVLDEFDGTEYAVMIGNATDVQLVYTRGGMTVDDVKAIASSSKWFSSAVFIALLEQGVMSLDDRPQDYISWWTSNPADPRSSVTLAQLLGFTSGFDIDERSSTCVRDYRLELEDCVRDLYDIGVTHQPGTVFVYGPVHMQIAALMAEIASGQAFMDLFQTLVADPIGLSATQASFPDGVNPYPAGGLVSTASDTAKFLQAILAGEYLPHMRETWEADRTPHPVYIERSWHYAIGHWRECERPEWDASCEELGTVSGGGALGWLPWIDYQSGLWGVVAYEAADNASQRTAAMDSLRLSNELRKALEKILD